MNLRISKNLDFLDSLPKGDLFSDRFRQRIRKKICGWPDQLLNNVLRFETMETPYGFQIPKFSTHLGESVLFLSLTLYLGFF